MKRSIALLLALVMLLSLAACAGKSNSDSTTPSTSTETNGTTESTDTADTSSEEVPDAASLVSDAFIDPINDWDQYNTMIDEMELIAALRPMLRVATEADYAQVKSNQEKEK